MDRTTEIQYLKDEILRLNKEIADLKIIIQNFNKNETRGSSYQFSPEENTRCISQAENEILFKSSYC